MFLILLEYIGEKTTKVDTKVNDHMLHGNICYAGLWPWLYLCSIFSVLPVL